MDNIVEFKKKLIPSPKDARQAIKTIYDFCNEQYQEDCDTGRCPLYKWCKISGREEYPCNWLIK